MMKLFSRVLRKISRDLTNLAHKLHVPERELRTEKWNAANNKKNLREEYSLTPNSVVIDVGGFKGDWASSIFSRYQSTVYVFEPLKEFSDYLEAKFKHNPKIIVKRIGLSDTDQETKINIDGDKSSTFLSDSQNETIHLKKTSSYLKELGITHVDLMKINIEGGEYDLLKDVINTGYIQNIDNIQVQFHDFVENAESKMKELQTQLAKTHHLTYQFPFVWENWQINKK